jgi:hypothetical protein
MAAEEDKGKISALPEHDALAGGEYLEIIVPKTGGAPGYDSKRIAAEKLGGNGPTPEPTVIGCVYITDIEPLNASDNVGTKVKTTDNHTLTSCVSSTTMVRVTVEAIAGPSAFTPVVKLNDLVTVPMTQVNADSVLFRGTATLNLTLLGGTAPYTVTASHGEGGSGSAIVNMDEAPVIDTAIFTGGYPAGQSEVKAGDTLSVRFSTSVPVVEYEIRDAGALVAKTGTLTAGVLHNITGCVVADRGTVSQNLGFQIRAKKASGTWSAWFSTSAQGTQADGVSYVKANNLYPTITMGVVTYPAGKEALDTGDVASVAHSVSNANSYTYSSPGAQLTVANPTVFEASKQVTQLGGAYNEATPNLQLVARRTANGATATATAIVKIATVSPQISISTPAARLRSGGNNGTVAQDHTITLTSNQALVEAPTLNAPEGTWKGSWVSDAAKKVWTRALTVHDDDDKGTFTFNSLSAKSLSGRIVTAITGSADYVLGGFVFRTLTVPAYPNRQVAIGTKVVNTAKLRCTNLSKGATGSLNYTYQAGQTAANDRYTIVTENTWYNCDNANATANTGGTQQIELEEAI